MSTPFFGSATGDPVNLTRLFGLQAAEGIPLEDAACIPYKSYGGALGLSSAWIDAQVINAQAMRSLGMKSKLDFTGQQFAMGDLDPGNHAHLAFMAQMLQGYDTALTSETTLWRLGQAQKVNNTLNLPFTYINDSDKGIPARHADVRVKGMSLTVQNRQNVSLGFEVRSGAVDFWGVPDNGAGSGTVLPILRGFHSNNFVIDATDGDAYVKIIGDTATEVTFQFKFTAAGSYSGTHTATKGVWCFCYTDANLIVPAGSWGQQIAVYFPTGANGQFVDDEVWIFPKRRTLSVAAEDYPLARRIPEVNCRFELDGEVFYVDQGITLNADVPGVITRYSPGFEQAVGTDRKGQQAITVSLNRRLVDMTLQRKLLMRETASLVIRAMSDAQVGNDANSYGFAFVMPSLTVSGSTHDAEPGAQNYDEQLTLIAGEPSTAFTWGAFNDILSELEVFCWTDLTEADLGLA